MSNPLETLSPEQIKALSPECMRVLLSQSENKINDISKMKLFFKQQKQEEWDSGNYNKKEGAEIQRILLKYPKDQFYITYNYNGEYQTNYNLYTFEEMQELLPTGVDIEKVSYSGDDYKDYQNPKCNIRFNDRKIQIVNSPFGYSRDIENGDIQYIAQLTHCHGNINIVHPALMLVAKYFFS